jgi:hypothetical protein
MLLELERLAVSKVELQAVSREFLMNTKLLINLMY